MAIASASEHFGAHFKMTQREMDTDASTAVVSDYVAMSGFKKFVVTAATTVKGGNGMVLLEIVAAESAAGANVTQIKTSGTIAADTVGDLAKLECTAAEIAQIGSDNGYEFTHVAARITNHHAGDENWITYILYDGPVFSGQTPATTLA